MSAGLFCSCHSSTWSLLLLYIPLFTLKHTPGKRESKGAGIAKANAGKEGAGDEDWRVGGGGEDWQSKRLRVASEGWRRGRAVVEEAEVQLQASVKARLARTCT